MAEWSDIVSYLRSSHAVLDERPDTMVQLAIETTDGRTQMAIVFNNAVGDMRWLQIESPIGKLDELDLRAVLEAGSPRVVGGLVTNADLAIWRQAVPLDNFDLDEFQAALVFVALTADELERQFIGEDRY